MASANGCDHARNPEAVVTKALELICFRDWCQDQVVKVMMTPADRNKYYELKLSFFIRGEPYVEFRRQMVVLLQNYRHVQVYWDVFHSWSTGRPLLVDYSLFFYPIYLCHRLDLIPIFATTPLGDTELRNSAPSWSVNEARQLAAQLAAELERQLDFEALAESNPLLYVYP